MEKLVKVTKYSDKIKEQRIQARIELDHPILVRDKVARMLAKVADNLPEELFLLIDSGYRTKKVQNNLWQSRSKTINGLVADPTKGTPPHNTGGAVDVAFQDKDGNEINLSKPFRKYYSQPKLISKSITVDAQNKRLLMNKLMLGVGFAPNPREYWHYSYGDKMWADYYKKKILYRGIESIDKSLLFSFSKRLLNKLIKKTWRLFRSVFNIEVNY